MSGAPIKKTARTAKQANGLLFRTLTRNLRGGDNVDRGAGVFELLLSVGGRVFADGGQDLRSGGFGHLLGFNEAEAGQRADDFDRVDLLRAGVLDNDVEFGRFFNRGGSFGRTRDGDGGDRRGGGNAPFFFQRLTRSAASRTLSALRSSTNLAISAMIKNSCVFQFFYSIVGGRIVRRSFSLGRFLKDREAIYPNVRRLSGRLCLDMCLNDSGERTRRLVDRPNEFRRRRQDRPEQLRAKFVDRKSVV